jgi:hypothetical protein
MTLLPSFFMVQLAMAPLPPHLTSALSDIEVETSIDEAAMFRLHFNLSRTMLGDFDALAIDLFRPLLPIRVSLSFGLGLPVTLINGYIRDTQLSAGATPGTSRLEVTGADALATTMQHIVQPFTWPNMPDSSIAAAIFGRYGMVPVTLPTPPTRTMRDTTSTQTVSDHAFLRQLADFHRYKLYIQPDPIAGVDMGYFRPVSSMILLPPQGVLSIDFGSQSNLTDFRVDNRMLQPAARVGLVTDPTTRVPVPVVAPVAAEPPMGLEPNLARIIPPPIHREPESDAANVAETLLRMTATVTESAHSVTAQGEVDGLKYARPLFPGLPVMVRGAGRQNSGAYLVTSVSHRISRDGYSQSFSALRNAVGLTGAELFVDPLAPAA